MGVRGHTSATLPVARKVNASADPVQATARDRYGRKDGLEPLVVPEGVAARDVCGVPLKSHSRHLSLLLYS
jgi:hypothetical protein